MRSALLVLFLFSISAKGELKLQVVQPEVQAAPKVVTEPAAVTAQPAAPPQPQAQSKSQAQTPTAAKPSNDISQLMSSMMGSIAGGRTDFGDDPPADADWNKFEYPDNHKFYYGGEGVGNIGNGLCTSKNLGRTQVTKGYCGMLADILRTDGTCANRAMNDILIAAGPSGNGIGDLGQYCSGFGQITTSNKVLVFQQVLAALITQESGWNAKAQEPPWTKNGQPMGGKGLFQIGVKDKSQDPDCEGLNLQTIFDPQTNMKCGACIALKNLAKDRTMGHGTGDSGARGMARYFGPLRDGQVKKRSAMAAAVNQYCEGSTAGSTSYAPVTDSQVTK